jgi:hypothetical protein
MRGREWERERKVNKRLMCDILQQSITCVICSAISFDEYATNNYKTTTFSWWRNKTLLFQNNVIVYFGGRSIKLGNIEIEREREREKEREM